MRTIISLMILLLIQIVVNGSDYSNCTSDSCTETNNVAMDIFFSYPIANLSNPTIRTLISNAADSLQSNGLYFKIANFLSDYGLNTFKNIIISKQFQSKAIRRDFVKTIFGEKTDYINYPNTTINGNTNIHPRNRMMNVKLMTIGKTGLPFRMVNMFTYEPLLNFLREIMIQSGTFTDLYLSHDTEGSVYIFYYHSGDHGEWHYDQHPLTCVYMLIKPDIGGRYLYYFDSTQQNQHDYNFTDTKWDIVDKILRNDTDTVKQYVNAIEYNEGDLYCFTGNTTLHRSEHSFNAIENNENVDIARSILVLSYADYAGFVHDQCRVANDACNYL